MDTVYCTVCIIVSETQCQDDLFQNLRQELRRGSLVLAVLASLRAEQYGYMLRKHLVDHGLEVDENTLYPLLRRLENDGLLLSEWREENKRKKRYYRLPEAGEAVLKRLLAEWSSLHVSLTEIAKEQEQ